MFFYKETSVNIRTIELNTSSSILTDAHVAARRAKKQERRKHVEEFRKIYIRQKIWLAKLYVRIHTIIHEHPDTCEKSIFEAIKRYAKLGIFTSSHLVYIDDLVHLYWEKRRAVRLVRTIYKNDAALYAVMFGHTPYGDVHVIEGPITLYFRCDDLRDYARIRFGYLSLHARITDHELAIADKSSGVSISSAPIRYRDLEGTLIAEKALESPFNETARNIYYHEEQHAFFRFITRQKNPSEWKNWKPKVSLPLTPFEEGSSTPHHVDALQRFLRYLRCERFDGEESAKNELLAYAVGGTHRDMVIQYLLAKEEDDGLYDYFKGYRKRIRGDCIFYASLPENFDALFDHVFEREYRRILEHGYDAIELLKRNGFSIHEIVGLLMMEPLRFWLKVARRLCPKGRIQQKHA